MLMMILAVMMISFAGNSADHVGVVVNGKAVEFDGAVPYIDVDAGRTMVPVRFVSEAMGVNVGWDGDKQMVVLEKGDQIVQMIIGQKTYARKNQYGSIKHTAMDVAPFIQKDAGRTIVPLRFVSEALGADVGWDGDTYTVTITTSNQSEETVFPTEKELEAFVDENVEGVTAQWKEQAKTSLKDAVSYYSEHIDGDFDYSQEALMGGEELKSYRGDYLFGLRGGNAIVARDYVFALDMPFANGSREEANEARKLAIYMIHQIFEEDADKVLADVVTIKDWINTEGYREGIANGMEYQISFLTASGLVVKFIKR